MGSFITAHLQITDLSVELRGGSHGHTERLSLLTSPLRFMSAFDLDEPSLKTLPSSEWNIVLLWELLQVFSSPFLLGCLCQGLW